MKSLALAKGEGVPTITTDSVAISTAQSAPDPTFGIVELQKSSGQSSYGAGSVAHVSASTAPKKPITVNCIDKTQVCFVARCVIVHSVMSVFQVVRNNYAE